MLSYGGNTMKKLLFGTLPLALIFLCPLPTMAARVAVDIHIDLPPAIVYAEPPQLIVLPETYVYVVPDQEIDIFFYNGWWWRPWEGRWYRSHTYDSGWTYYQNEPSFYREIPSTWRNDYRDRRWRGHQWDVQRISRHQVEQNWSGWEKNRYWEQQQTWGVRDLQIHSGSQSHLPMLEQRIQQEPQPQHLEINSQYPQQQQQYQGNQGKHNKVKPNNHGQNKK